MRERCAENNISLSIDNSTYKNVLIEILLYQSTFLCYSSIKYIPRIVAFVYVGAVLFTANNVQYITYSNIMSCLDRMKATFTVRLFETFITQVSCFYTIHMLTAIKT